MDARRGPVKDQIPVPADLKASPSVDAADLILAKALDDPVLTLSACFEILNFELNAWAAFLADSPNTCTHPGTFDTIDCFTPSRAPLIVPFIRSRDVPILRVSESSFSETPFGTIETATLLLKAAIAATVELPNLATKPFIADDVELSDVLNSIKAVSADWAPVENTAKKERSIFDKRWMLF